MTTDDIKKGIKSLLTENFPIKLFSILFAVVLWFHVAAPGETEVNFAVPLELRDVPDSLSVVSEAPEYIDVRLIGQESIIRGLSARDIRMSVSLTDCKPGENLINLSQTNVVVHASAKVKGLRPSQLSLRLEKIIEKRLPVQPEFAGHPAPGHLLSDVHLSPNTVMVQGPETAISKLVNIKTSDINIEGVAGSFDRTVKLTQPQQYGIRLESEDVRVTVNIIKQRK